MASAPQDFSTGSSPKPRFERIIEFLATGLGESVAWLAERGVLFIVFAAMWFGIGAMLALSPGSLDELWRGIGAMPLVVQLVLWLLFLPVMAGLWAWETTWPVLARLAVVIALAAWTMLVFRPTWLRRPEASTGTSNHD